MAANQHRRPHTKTAEVAAPIGNTAISQSNPEYDERCRDLAETLFLLTFSSEFCALSFDSQIQALGSIAFGSDCTLRVPRRVFILSHDRAGMLMSDPAVAALFRPLSVDEYGRTLEVYGDRLVRMAALAVRELWEVK
jgi:hypothetical protein